MSTDSAQIGNIIRSARHSKGLTQEELGDMIGVTKATINKYESGTVTNYTRPRIEALSKALDISPLVFLQTTRVAPGLRVKSVETKDGVVVATVEAPSEAVRVAKGLSIKKYGRAPKLKHHSPELEALEKIYVRLPGDKRIELLTFAQSLLNK